MNSIHENQSKYGRICVGELITEGNGTKSGMLPEIATAGNTDGPPGVMAG
jgi:hypothetical protein